MITLRIISPEGQVAQHQARSVVLPGGAGSFEVLAGHAPLVSTLTGGKVVCDGKEVMPVSGGIVEVAGDRVTLYI